MKIFVTGCAGFIGYFLCKRLLLTTENEVVGLDNLNDYYDVNLKKERLNGLMEHKAFKFVKGDLSDSELLKKIFDENNFDTVINLAAQAGVRYSITNPDAYIQSNIIGFYNVLECCRYHNNVKLIFASSSSVYGNNSKIPYSIDDKVDEPVSLYAATKKSDELLAYCYSKLYGIKTIGLRFFTVYGPMGRPDMAYFSFTNKLINKQTIEIFNYGNCKRDFTYVDDIVEGIMRIIFNEPKTPYGDVKYKLYNIGNSKPVNLLDFVSILGDELKTSGVLSEDFNLQEHMKLVPMQPGDVEVTYADTTALEKDFGYKPSTDLTKGLKNFAEWYIKYSKN